MYREAEQMTERGLTGGGRLLITGHQQNPCLAHPIFQIVVNNNNNNNTKTKIKHNDYLPELVHEYVDGKLWVDVGLECSQGRRGCRFSYLMLSSYLWKNRKNVRKKAIIYELKKHHRLRSNHLQLWTLTGKVRQLISENSPFNKHILLQLPSWPQERSACYIFSNQVLKNSKFPRRSIGINHSFLCHCTWSTNVIQSCSVKDIPSKA